MPRDASQTRARLLDAAEELFATRGIYDVATAEIVAAAGQRNTSAVTYHFGSRQDLLRALLTERDAPVDEERGELLEGMGADPTTSDLLSALVIPYAACLGSQPGRNYLRIVDQVRDGFSEWRTVPRLAQPNLATALGLLEQKTGELDASLRQERLLGMMMLMTSSAAVRAQHIEAGHQPALGHEEYVANLTAMLSGVVDAAMPAEV